MQIEIPEFKEFTESNISGRMILNPYWLEHLLNLFYQEYVAEFQMEVWDTQHNHSKLIHNWAFGIIGQEFDKKHLALRNSSPPVRTSDKKSDFDKSKEFNMGDKVTATPSPKSPMATSHHPNIPRFHPNFKFHSKALK